MALFACGWLASAGTRFFWERCIMTINLSTTVLSGLASSPPGIDSDSLFGTVAVWADAGKNHVVTMAISGSSPPYDPMALNPDWTSLGTPTVAIATDWEEIFVAFADRDGFIQLVSSGDGWTGMQTLSQERLDDGPALAYGDNLLYIAWKTHSSQLAFATRDENGQINYVQTDKRLTSRPTICASDPDRIYVLCGGSLNGPPQPILIYLSVDGGKTFTDVATQANKSFGPPSLALLDQFYLAWADEQSSQLRLAQTSDLSSYTAMDYNVGCHGGDPALIPVATITDINNPASWIFSLSSGWTMGASDQTNHHVTVGSFGPLQVSSAQIEKQRAKIAKQIAPRALPQCPDPSTVYDPATGKCVSKLGCWGGCVLSSIVKGVFNPITYAWCVIKCKS